MRKKKEPSPIDEKGVREIIEALEKNASKKARIYRTRAAAAKRHAMSMPPERRSMLAARRARMLAFGRAMLRKDLREAYANSQSMGQITAMSDAKYLAIVNEARLAGVKPGQPFIHVNINRIRARYARPIAKEEDIKTILSRYTCLNYKTIHKAFCKKRDVWMLYAVFNGKRVHVAAVFGMDLSYFREYRHRYVRPDDYRKPGRPRRMPPLQPQETGGKTA